MKALNYDMCGAPLHIAGARPDQSKGAQDNSTKPLVMRVCLIVVSDAWHQS